MDTRSNHYSPSVPPTHLDKGSSFFKMHQKILRWRWPGNQSRGFRTDICSPKGEVTITHPSLYSWYVHKNGTLDRQMEVCESQAHQWCIYITHSCYERLHYCERSIINLSQQRLGLTNHVSIICELSAPHVQVCLLSSKRLLMEVVDFALCQISGS